jgi:hypothetical protein
MRPFPIVPSIVCFSAVLLALAAWQPSHRPNHAAYRDCIERHPQRYCAITFLGAR